MEIRPRSSGKKVDARGLFKVPCLEETTKAYSAGKN